MAKVVPFGYRSSKKSGMTVATGHPNFEHDYPEGFCLVRDTREQTGLFLPKPPKGLMLVVNTLKYGDYSIFGFETSISVERKNIDDLWSSVTVDSERFKRELEGLMEFERKWILIEGLESEYLSFRPERKIHPNAIRQALASIEGRMGIPVHQCESKQYAERWMLDVFIKYYRMKREPV